MKLLILALAFLLALPANAEDARISGEIQTCSMEYAPVCGSKQVQCVTTPCNPIYETYSNGCMMRADGAELVHVGECTDSETGPIVSSEKPYTPPSGCVAWFDGCNSCHGGAGNAACSKKACATYAPGYCSMWKQAIPPASVDPKIEAETEASAPTAAPNTPASFLSRVWTFLFGWL